jgi:hypothetical protein
VTDVVHDQDSKITAIRREFKWEVSEFFDRNHVMKRVAKAWEKPAFVQKPGAKTKSWILNKYKTGVWVWWFTCVSAQVDTADREKMWSGAPDYYINSAD